jgi:hypothetical protein
MANILISVVPDMALVKKVGKKPTHSKGCCSEDTAAYRNTDASPILKSQAAISSFFGFLLTVDCILAYA